ncbi:MAG: hypothetical protein ACE5JJ_03780 [Nitrospinota bacterium]
MVHWLWVFLLLVPALAWGQVRPPGDPNAPARLGAPPAPGAKAKPKTPDSAVLARVNGKVITMGDFRKRLALLPLPMQIRANRQKAKFLSGIIQTELLFQEATRRGIDKSRAV